MKKILSILGLTFITLTSFATTYYINAGGYYYSPSELTIHLGDTVVWINDGGNHDVNANINSQTGLSFNNPESFQSNITSTTGATIHTQIFTIAGNYNYDCSVGMHAAQGMVGSINVVNNGSVVDIIVNSEDHQTLETAVLTADLAETLSGSGPFTVFAPSDNAFDNVPEQVLELLLANTEQLTELLLNHVHEGEVFSSDLEDNMTIPTISQNELIVSIDGTTIMIDMSTVVNADLLASNGVVHVIDNVLLPDFSEVDSTVWSVIEFSPIHQTLETAIITAELDETLSGDGPFTVFAPTDEAFEAIPEGELEDLLANNVLLTQILLHHVHSGDVLSTSLLNGMEVATLNNDFLVITINEESVMIDMATVVQADIETDNGVVHIIDKVLIPEDPANILSIKNNKSIYYSHTINLLGEKVDRNSIDKVLIDIYSDGTSIKRYNIRN